MTSGTTVQLTSRNYETSPCSHTLVSEKVIFYDVRPEKNGLTLFVSLVWWGPSWTLYVGVSNSSIGMHCVQK